MGAGGYEAHGCTMVADGVRSCVVGALARAVWVRAGSGCCNAGEECTVCVAIAVTTHSPDCSQFEPMNDRS